MRGVLVGTGGRRRAAGVPALLPRRLHRRRAVRCTRRARSRSARGSRRRPSRRRCCGAACHRSGPGS
ncbi:hypothetical protein ACP4OV_020763 [Aristida adscensionis]